MTASTISGGDAEQSMNCADGGTLAYGQRAGGLASRTDAAPTGGDIRAFMTAKSAGPPERPPPGQRGAEAGGHGPARTGLAAFLMPPAKRRVDD